MFTFLLNLPPTILEWPASFLGLFLSSLYKDQFANQQLGSQPGDQRNGPWKRGIGGGNLKLAIDLCVGSSGPDRCRCLFMLDACGLLHKYRDDPQMLAGLLCLFEELHSSLWQRRERNGCLSGQTFSVGSLAGHRCPSGGESLS